ncbi:MAG: hypothetical protein RLZZ44_1596, partial [Bacteroidota bacterium]
WDDILRSILNAPNSINLSDFISINFNSQSPIMVLVDGGNEHYSPLPFLHSICNFLQSIPAGHMKVVLSWRSSTVGQMPLIPETMEPLVFSVANRDERGLLAAKALRLVGMNKLEIEGAWNKYSGDKNLRCKPNFQFSDLIISDSALVEELSNPLLLRLFMELFHGKGLPKSSKGFINLWSVWWSKIQENKEEAEFLIALSHEMMKHQKLQVSLDSLFDHPTLGDSVKNIQIDSPYQQLIQKGIISQYFIDHTLQVSFTMETALYYVASLDINSNNLTSIPLDNGMWKEAVKFFIWQIATSEHNEILFEKIDDKDFPFDLLVKGLAEALIFHGVTATLEKLLIKPSERDYDILVRSIELLSEKRPGEREQRATEILQQILQYNFSLNSTLILKLMETASKKIANEAYEKLISFDKNWSTLELISFSKYCSRFGQHRQSSDFLEKAKNSITSEPWQVKEKLFEYQIENARELGKYVESLRIIDDLEHFLQNENKWNDLKQAKISCAKGNAYELLLKYNEANKYYSETLHLLEKILGHYDEQVIKTLLHLGDVTFYLCKYDLAFEIYENCLKRYQKVFGDKHINIAATQIRIGRVWDGNGGYDKALEYFKKALSIYIGYYGESHPNVADTLKRIGNVWYAKCRNDKALEYFEKALCIYIEYYGELHPYVASVLEKIGIVWDNIGNKDKALEYYEKVLKISIEYYGESHPWVSWTYCLIAPILVDKRRCRYDKALEYFENDLKINIDYYGESHPNVASSLILLGDFLELNSTGEIAFEHFKKALSIYKNYYGESHPNVATTLNRIGHLRKVWGQYDKAFKYFERALNMHIVYYGESHPMVAISLMQFGEISLIKDEYDKALEYFKKALSIYIGYYGEYHPNVAFALKQI